MLDGSPFSTKVAYKALHDNNNDACSSVGIKGAKPCQNLRMDASSQQINTRANLHQKAIINSPHWPLGALARLKTDSTFSSPAHLLNKSGKQSDIPKRHASTTSGVLPTYISYLAKKKHTSATSLCMNLRGTNDSLENLGHKKCTHIQERDNHRFPNNL
jgi:hypothetical protein